MTIALPQHALKYLSIACGAVFGLYVIFMIMAVSFASLEVERARDARTKEASVVALETDYYAAIDRLAGSNPTALGYVTPSDVEYVNESGSPVVTRADR
jgi:hypothetical protein